MAAFPALEPDGRDHTFPDVPQVVGEAWGGAEARATTAGTARWSGARLVLSFLERPQAEIALIRTHYAAQREGLLPFELPTTTLAGDPLLISRAPIWRYISRPTEESLPNGLISCTVELEGDAVNITPLAIDWI